MQRVHRVLIVRRLKKMKYAEITRTYTQFYRHIISMEIRGT